MPLRVRIAQDVRSFVRRGGGAVFSRRPLGGFVFLEEEAAGGGRGLGGGWGA